MSKESSSQGRAARPKGRCGGGGVRPGFWLAAALWLSPPLSAEIRFDASVPGAALNGPDYRIPASAGRLDDSNLFHSFERFGLSAGESATFAGPASVEHVIARVTGGQPSAIDGRLASEIPGASLWLLNPAGVLFGPGASLDVDGAFHASSAGSLRFADGTRLTVGPGAPLVLTSAPPVAFGFLGPGAGPIAVRGAQLRGHPGATLTLAGGSITVEAGGSVSAPAGRINVLALDSAGEAWPEAAAPVSGGAGGPVSLRDSPRDAVPDGVGDGALASDGPGGGAIFIRGGRVVVEAADVSTLALGPGEGAALSVRAGELLLSEGGRLYTASVGPGQAGALTVEAQSLQATGRPGDGFNPFDPTTLAKLLSDYTGIASFAGAGPAGDAGRIEVAGQQLTLRQGAVIAGVSLGAGRGPEIAVSATGRLEVAQRALLGTIALADGAGGDVRVSAPDVLLRGDFSLASGGIGSTTQGAGAAGSVQLRAERLQLRDGAAIDASTVAGTGAGGSLLIEAGHSLIGPFSRLSAATFGPGAGGNIRLSGETLQITGPGFAPQGNLFEALQGLLPPESAVPTGIDLSTYALGPGGSLDLRVDRLALSGSGRILSNSFVAGPGGSLRLHAGQMHITGGASVATAAFGIGDAGNVALSGSAFALEGDSSVLTSAAASDGGNITLRFSDRVLLRDAGISTAVGSGASPGGDIAIDARFVVLQGSRVIADAFGGPGGNIRVVADNFIADADSLIRASSARSVDGTVAINAPQIDVAAAVRALPENPVDPGALLSRQCRGQAGAAPGSLVLQQPLAAMPGALMPVMAVDRAAVPARAARAGVPAGGVAPWLLACGAPP